jgi:hypothetical protein
MFTITNKLRTIVAIGAVGAALASSGVASAATVVHQPGTATATAVVAPSVAYLDPSKFGSANPAYSDQRCEDLANLVNQLNSAADAAATAGQYGMARNLGSNAAATESTLNSNCFEMD